MSPPRAEFARCRSCSYTWQASFGEFSLSRLVRNDERHRRLMQQVVGDPAEQHLAQPGMAVAAHHHEGDLEPLGLFNERSRDVVRAVADAMQRRIDPVVLKMIDCIKTDQRLELGRML